HVMNQLGLAATFYFLLFNEGDIKIKDFEYNDAMLLLQRRILEGCEAWRAVCKEYGVDDMKMLDGLPYSETIDMMELTVRAANADAPIELSDLADTIEGYKSAIETMRKKWE
ncbi:MAG: hypothetical protein NTW69_19585, partial [Chloroflexi bacterium]|nr:hypothetical protein [Chloroflexota bacterium]